MYQQGSIDNLHLLHANKMAETLMRLQQQGQDYVLPPGLSSDRRAADDTRRALYEHPSAAILNFTQSNHSAGAAQVPESSSGGHNVASSGETDASASSLFVIISRTEYELLKQELSGLRQSIGDLKSSITREISQLKVETQELKHCIDSCLCSNGGSSGWHKDSTDQKVWSGSERGRLTAF